MVIRATSTKVATTSTNANGLLLDPQPNKTSLSLYRVSGIYLLGFISGILASQFLNNVSHLDDILLVKKTNLASPISSTSNIGDFSKATISSEAASTEQQTIHQKERSSHFDVMVNIAYEHMLDSLPASVPRPSFDLQTWTDRTSGGLKDKDRTVLARIYSEADSVMEYGLGESTYMANHVGVRRYAGIDSDPVWVTQTREKVDSRFRFYLADIGSTKEWGYPNEILGKQILNFQLAPLILERDAFDVYMVDGRYRFPCVLACFLHASSRGAPANATTVLLHDCATSGAKQPREIMPRQNYHAADDLLELVEHSGWKLCVYKRKHNTTDKELLDRWMLHKIEPGR